MHFMVANWLQASACTEVQVFFCPLRAVPSWGLQPLRRLLARVAASEGPPDTLALHLLPQPCYSVHLVPVSVRLPAVLSCAAAVQLC